MQKLPLVSIVTIQEGSTECLIATVLSVRRQSYPLIEYIVVKRDGENAVDAALRNMAHLFDMVADCADGNIYDSLNAGIERARGEWIMLLDSGTVFYDDKVIDYLIANQTVSDEIIHGDVVQIGTGKARGFPPDHLYWSGMTFDRQAAFVRATVFEAGMFDVSFEWAADFHFFSRCRLAGIKFRPVIRALVARRAPADGQADVLGKLRQRYRVAKAMFPSKPIEEQLLLLFPGDGDVETEAHD